MQRATMTKRSGRSRRAVFASETAGPLLAPAPQAQGCTKVSQVSGGAFGFKTVVGIFGNPPTTRGDSLLDAVVELPCDGSATPIVEHAPYADGTHGPAVIFKAAGPITVATQGENGEAGGRFYARSSAIVNRVGTWADGGPEEEPIWRQRLLGIMDPFLASEVSSRCSITRDGDASGETRIVGGRIFDTDWNGNPTNERAVPVNPAPNTTASGMLGHLGGAWRITFNEQLVSGDRRSLTVTAVHVELFGPIAVGHLYIGQSRCGFTG